MSTILTYGTFDLFHIGHLNLLKRLKGIGTTLGVGVSTDEFNAAKGKKSIIPFNSRIEIIRSIRCVDFAFPEESWDQKSRDIKKYSASIFAIGDDWAGKFDHLKDICEVIYLPRTEGISSTEIRQTLASLDGSKLADIHKAIDLLSKIASELR
jgi:glycerol-3-phosphate cytidylyltransferase